jgi:hypothetical protein
MCGETLTYIRRYITFLATSATLAAGCATAQPEVKVIAMSQAQARPARAKQVLVFMEVVNPTNRDLQLSRLDYRLSADSWFSTEGTVSLARAVAPNSSAVVEIAVPVDDIASRRAPGVVYKLDGRLFAHADHVERSWSVTASGEIRDQSARFRFPAPAADVDVAEAP